MAYYAVEYVYNPSMTETMDEVRPTHRAFLSGLLEQGINVASGPLVGEIPGALILINAESQADVERILNEDPFYVAEVIQARLIREWNPVIPGVLIRAIERGRGRVHTRHRPRFVSGGLSPPRNGRTGARRRCAARPR